MQVILMILSFLLVFQNMKKTEPTSILLIKNNTQDDVIAMGKKIVDNLSKHKYEAVREDFIEGLKANLDAKKIGNAWEVFTGQVGDFIKIESTKVNDVNGFKQILYKCVFDRSNGIIEVGFSSDKKVVALFIRPL